MSSILGDDDRRAVDLLMQQRNPHSAPPSHVTSGSTNAAVVLMNDFDHEVGFGSTLQSSVGERLDVVEQMLGMLDVLPAIEPPADLVSRTMDFIMQATPQRIDRSTPPGIGTNAQSHA